MRLKEKINDLGASKTPFVFCLNYAADDGFVYELDSLPENIAFYIDGKSYGYAEKHKTPAITKKTPVLRQNYNLQIKTLKEKIADGDIYMANLTCPTKIEIEGSLDDIFCSSTSEFRLLLKDGFVVSSPEAFVEIRGHTISTFPMKGTAVFDGEESVKKLLENPKELAEHTMTVDLLRNDLSIVASGVRVEEFRYPIIIEANGQKLIQTVSKISGELPRGFMLGDTLFALLPAGSITGTPKRKCVEILKEIEGYERGFFCGIFGYFDGEKLKSGVSIRYIEQTDDGFIYKSGGGITIESDENAEYEEMLKKVYLAF